MRIHNAQVLLGREFRPGGAEFDRTITAAGPLPPGEGIDAGGCYLVPGLVDIHTHGGAGEDFSDGSPAGLARLLRWYSKEGVTACLATTMTLPEPALLEALEALRSPPPPGGARCLGVHLKGPFLSAAKRGAHPEAHLRPPDPALFRRLQDACGGRVRRITLAPELPGALPFLEQAARQCTVSLGHSAADHDTALAAFQAGAVLLTHLFNGMPPLHHRSPGLIGAALDSGAWAEVIADGLHVHPSALRAAFRLFGERTILVSDSLRCAGLGDGTYTLAGQPVTVTAGRAALPDGTLAGSCLSLLEMVRRAVSWGIPLEAALYAASTAPAEAIGAGEIGAIAPGKAADLLVLDRELRVKMVFIGGERVV